MYVYIYMHIAYRLRIACLLAISVTKRTHMCIYIYVVNVKNNKVHMYKHVRTCVCCPPMY